MATSLQQLFKYGNSSIHVHSADFEDGYANGFLDIIHEAPMPTDTLLSESLLKHLFDANATNEWNTGALLGAAHHLLLGKTDFPASNASHVSFGSATLCLNNWRFREGFFTGQQDYWVGQDELPPQKTLTATSLLRFIAHCDPESERYFWTQDESEVLEDMLGRLVGFLFAALSCSASTPTTEPLPNIRGQEV